MDKEKVKNDDADDDDVERYGYPPGTTLDIILVYAITIGLFHSRIFDLYANPGMWMPFILMVALGAPVVVPPLNQHLRQEKVSGHDAKLRTSRD